MKLAKKSVQITNTKFCDKARIKLMKTHMKVSKVYGDVSTAVFDGIWENKERSMESYV